MKQVTRIRARWIGHQLQADIDLVLDEAQTLAESERIVAAVRKILLTHVRRLAGVTIELVSPLPAQGPGKTPVASSPLGILPPRYRD